MWIDTTHKRCLRTRKKVTPAAPACTRFPSPAQTGAVDSLAGALRAMHLADECQCLAQLLTADLRE